MQTAVVTTDTSDARRPLATATPTITPGTASPLSINATPSTSPVSTIPSVIEISLYSFNKKTTSVNLAVTFHDATTIGLGIGGKGGWGFVFYFYFFIPGAFKSIIYRGAS